MKKGSGFEKFYKGREKTGAAKKENFRQEKREIRKEREEKIANAKRQKRSQNRETSSAQPPKYNLEPPGSGFQKKQKENRSAPGYRTEHKPFKKDKQGNKDYTKSGSSHTNNKRIELTPKRHNNRSTKPEKWDGHRPSDGLDKKPYETSNPGFSKAEEQKTGWKDRPKQYNSSADKSHQGHRIKSHHNEAHKPNQSGGAKPYKKEDKRPYNSNNAKPVLQKKELPKKVGHQDKAGAHLRNETEAKTPINRQHTSDELMPLNKYIAHSGVCSRRDAVDLIKGGKVKVNGELILEPGHKVSITDDVKVAGKKMLPVKDFVYILLNKPKDYITTTDDPQERRTVLDLLKGAPQIRIYPVGRLDRNTSGVLLLTNDGDLSQKLTHPSNEIKKVYAVTLDKPLTKTHFETILKGITLEDGIANVDSLAFTDSRDPTQLGVELHSGRNRIVRRIFEHLGYDVKGLDRVVFAGLTKKNITRGKWRHLTEREVRDLKFFKRGRR